MNFFHKNFKYFILTSKFSKKEVARELDVMYYKLRLFNKDVNPPEPNYETLIKISDFFNVSIDDLLKKDLQNAKKENLELIEKEHIQEAMNNIIDERIIKYLRENNLI